jgi:hypothetical protein
MIYNLMMVHYQISKLTHHQIDLLARALGFEPRSKVLETRMLPLHHARIPLTPGG